MTFNFASEKEENEFYCVREPTPLKWFARHRIAILEIAVAKSHTVFLGCHNYTAAALPPPAEAPHRPSVFHHQLTYGHLTDVYVCGDNTYGKLGLGHTCIVPVPVRVEHYFPKHFHQSSAGATAEGTASASGDGGNKEVIVSIAASDEASFILKQSAVLGSLVYFCGRQNNKDGQLTPLQLQCSRSYRTGSRFFPSSTAAALSQPDSGDVVAPHNNQFYKLCGSKGNQVFIISNFGEVLTFGNHSSTAVATGTTYFNYYQQGSAGGAGSNAEPRLIKSLLPFQITDVAAGGTFVVSYCAFPYAGPSAAPPPPPVYANHRHQQSFGRRAEADVQALLQLNYLDEPPKADGEDHPAHDHNKLHEEWDLIVAHNDRLVQHGGQVTNDVEAEKYERGRFVFFQQYFDETHVRLQYSNFKQTLSARPTHPALQTLTEHYLAAIPAAPPLSQKLKYKFDKLHTSEITIGQKVRLWMTDVYALGTVTKILSHYHATVNEEEDEGADAAAANHVRVLVEWQRDDWDEEEVSLYSVDETLSSEEEEEAAEAVSGAPAKKKTGRILANRWQPFWFEKNEDGECFVERGK
ncbi:hypothetical protein STCU_06175 [Strigomonas culicis]|uniref:Uncharacterized protein n=1 Tax=Strigomonas culicis TaxID=28005 RepID=S9U7A5_9TRYP|nr:hypothetical protein STCU_06175 [Strigomonas culicis]|eukprot:EPY26597.1 hypothetical protein STCU_06175 [Strigomonas culicis]